VNQRPQLNQLNVIVADMKATVAFYRLLGLEIAGDHDDVHIEVRLPGMLVEFDHATSIHHWDSGWSGKTGSGLVIGFAVASREAVDGLYGDVTGAGFRGRQPPYDAFWGARYAIVEDPDGNGVGLMSPIDSARKFWPPQPLPKA